MEILYDAFASGGGGDTEPSAVIAAENESSLVVLRCSCGEAFLICSECVPCRSMPDHVSCSVRSVAVGVSPLEKGRDWVESRVFYIGSGAGAGGRRGRTSSFFVVTSWARGPAREDRSRVK